MSVNINQDNKILYLQKCLITLEQAATVHTPDNPDLFTLLSNALPKKLLLNRRINTTLYNLEFILSTHQDLEKVLGIYQDTLLKILQGADILQNELNCFFGMLQKYNTTDN